MSVYEMCLDLSEKTSNPHIQEMLRVALGAVRLYDSKQSSRIDKERQDKRDEASAEQEREVKILVDQYEAIAQDYLKVQELLGIEKPKNANDLPARTENQENDQRIIRRAIEKLCEAVIEISVKKLTRPLLVQETLNIGSSTRLSNPDLVKQAHREYAHTVGMREYFKTLIVREENKNGEAQEVYDMRLGRRVKKYETRTYKHRVDSFQNYIDSLQGNELAAIVSKHLRIIEEIKRYDERTRYQGPNAG